MNKQELESKNIIIASVEVLDWGIKVKSEQGLIFNVPAVIKSGEKAGSPTKAHTDLIALPNNGMGLNKCMKFVTVDNSQGGKSRYVRMITEPVADGEQSKYVSPAMNQSQPVTIEKNDVNWDDVNFGKCKHQFLLEKYKMIIQGKCVSGDGLLEDSEKEAEKWATMSMRKLDNKIDVQKVAKQVGGVVVDEGTYQEHLQDDVEGGSSDIKVENIPF